MTSDPPSSRRLTLWYLAVPLVVLWVHAASHLPFAYDDTFISLRYAKRLLAGQGLTWNDNEYVEGYSNLLWVLSCAKLGALGIDLVAATRVLGFIGMTVAVALVTFAYRPRPKELANSGSYAPALIGGLVMALSGPISVWTIGGLEQPFVAAFLAWAYVAMFPVMDGNDVSFGRGLWVGWPLALGCLTRPDGPLWVATFMLAALLVQGFRKPVIAACFGIGLLPLLAVAGQTAFRVYYYDDWLPNTAYVKAHLSPERVLDGAWYMAKGVFFAWPALLLSGAGIVAAWRADFQRGRVVLLLLSAAVWGAYVTWVGGDICPTWRHWAPIYVAIGFLTAIGAEWLTSGDDGDYRRSLYTGYVRVLGLLLAMQIAAPAYQWARHEVWEWRGEVIGLLLKDAFGDRKPLLAIDPAGALPYFSELPTLDMLGLNDRYIAKHPLHTDDPTRIGHDHINPKYVLDRRPDFIIFYSVDGGPPEPPNGQYMEADPRFYQNYQLVRFRGQRPFQADSRIWVHRYGKVGIERTYGVVDIPAWLLQAFPPRPPKASDESLLAMFSDEGGFGAQIQGEEQWTTPSVDLSGSWQFEIVPPVTGATTELDGEVLEENGPGRFRLPPLTERTKIELQLRLPTPCFVEKLRFVLDSPNE